MPGLASCCSCWTLPAGGTAGGEKEVEPPHRCVTSRMASRFNVPRGAVTRAMPETRNACSAVPRCAVPAASNCSASLQCLTLSEPNLLSKDKRDHENARVRVRRSTENASSVNGRCGRSHPLSTQPVRRPASAQRRDARRTRTPSLRRYDARTKAFYRNRTTRPTHA